jgi:hypothetical protein
MSMIGGLATIPTKTCPNCGREVAKRKGGEFCPHCGIRLYSYRVPLRGKGVPKGRKRTIWVADDPSCKQLALYLRDRIRVYENNPLPDFVFLDWKAELGMAHMLLDRCEGNMALAKRVIDSYFDPKLRAILAIGNTPDSFRYIIWKGGHLSLVLAQAKADLAYERIDRRSAQLEIGDV